tara:strand:- start:214 stop:741 length:528 start_codon:yes stop_codon:yes gene_type:complete
MKSIFKFILIATLGAIFAVFLPRQGVLSSSGEIVSFLSLLMAGILPAMTLTATVLRGESLSVREVNDYTRALKSQMQFWAIVFLFSVLSVGSIILAEILNKLSRNVFQFGDIAIAKSALVSICIMLFGANFALLLSRLRSAYLGLVSILDFNSTNARAAAKIVLDVQSVKLTRPE